jgi:cathepsin F
MDARFLMLYRRGVANPRLCSKKSFNHSVLLVGFGYDVSQRGKSNSPFWRLKFSWGAGFGENGFVRLARGQGTCGVDAQVIGAALA